MRLHRRLGPPDPHQERGRPQVAQGVQRHRERRLEEPDQEAGRGRPRDLRRGPRDLQLRVALDQLVAVHDRGQVALVGDVEEHGQAAVDEADGVELPDRQGVERERDGDRGDRGGAADVGHDHDRASPQAVHPHAGREAEQDERQELDRRQQPELERADLERRRGDQRQRQLGDGAAEDGDRLGRPELEEVGVAQEAATRRRHGDRVYGDRQPMRDATSVAGGTEGPPGRRADRPVPRRTAAPRRLRPCSIETCSSKACPTSPRAGASTSSSAWRVP